MAVASPWWIWPGRYFNAKFAQRHELQRTGKSPRTTGWTYSTFATRTRNEIIIEQYSSKWMCNVAVLIQTFRWEVRQINNVHSTVHIPMLQWGPRCQRTIGSVRNIMLPWNKLSRPSRISTNQQEGTSVKEKKKPGKWFNEKYAQWNQPQKTVYWKKFASNT